jgi:hypothetical protein
MASPIDDGNEIGTYGHNRFFCIRGWDVTGSWNGLAVKPMDRGKFCNRTSVMWIRVVSSCYADGLVFHNDQYQATQGYDSVVLAVVALVHVRVCLCLFTISGST